MEISTLDKYNSEEKQKNEEIEKKNEWNKISTKIESENDYALVIPVRGDSKEVPENIQDYVKNSPGNFLSCSLCNKESAQYGFTRRDNVFTAQGVIVIPTEPSKTIIATAPRYEYSSNNNGKNFEEVWKGGKISSPKELLNESSRYFDNTVILDNNKENRVARVVVLVDKDDNPIDDYGKELIKKANEQNIPVNKIKRKLPEEEQVA